MTQSYMVRGNAKVRLEGVARVVDIDGNIVLERNLADLGEIEIPIKRCSMYGIDGDQYGVTFVIDNVFLDIPKGVKDA